MIEHEKNKVNKLSYVRTARAYAGDEPIEDDPDMREAARMTFLSRVRGNTILEIGCGPGTDAKCFSDAGFWVVATDAVYEFVQIVRERYPLLDACQMDMTCPSFASGSFDGVYGFACFIHLPRAMAGPTLAALRKLLKPHGILYLAVISSSRCRDYIIEDWGNVADNPMLFTCYEPAELEDMMGQAGFERVEIVPLASEVYSALPRLMERGIEQFQVVGHVGDNTCVPTEDRGNE